jgi:hypothetical protein
MNKKIKVVCNPKDSPIKFPADIEYLEFTSNESDKKLVEEWANKNKKIVLDYMRLF